MTSAASANEFPIMELKGATKENVPPRPRQSNPTFVNPEDLCRPSKELAKKTKQNSSQPIRFRHERSDSDDSLHESERATEYRDYCMYVRIVNGMWSNSNTKNPRDPSLVNVMRTRHSYKTRRDCDINFEEKVSTPPPGLHVNLSGRFTSPLRKRHVEQKFSSKLWLSDTTRCTKVMDDDGSADEILIFELEL